MKKHRNFTSFLLYCLGFILVSEWIWPVKDLTNSTDIWVFVVFLAISFLVTFLQVPLLFSLLIKGAVVVFLLHWLYFEESFFQLSWMLPFLQEIQDNIALAFSADLPEVSNLFRSLLFFILLWLMTYLLHYWVIQRRRILQFFIMTILYITVLDTFTPYNAENSIVRTVIVGFFVLGILTFYRLKEQEHMESVLSRKWLIFLTVMVGLSVVIGFALPKQEPIWPDPVPYIQLLGEQGEEDETAAVQRVGYGTDDSRLGGPFVGDSTVVFRTEVESRHYWKVETKDVYTGKGWDQSLEVVESIPFSQNSDVPLSSFIEGNMMGKTVETSHVIQMDDYQHVIYPLGIKRIQSDFDSTFELDPSIEKIYSYNGSRSIVLPSYSVTFDVPAYNITDLTSTVDAFGVNRDFMTRYTQLPDTLPNRVKGLAVEITNGKDNWFEQAKAIEQYLQGPDFSYDTKDVSVPGESDDYVDQFLFESMRGYCDNFSSSMVALLRSLDIPARWVKGYTAGEIRGSAENLRMYEVTNNNAHSWVEVYFPNAGWVSFEPTPGFSNNVTFQSDEALENNVENSEPITRQEQPKQEEEKPQKEMKSNEKFTFGSIWQKIKEFAALAWGWLTVSVLAAAGIGYLLFHIRVRWLPYYYIWRFKRLKPDEEHLAKAYIILLKQLQQCGLKRKAGQTLREYALAVDQHFSTSEMVRLTVQYEKYIYGNQAKKSDWGEMMELWEYLIKKTIA